MNRLAASAMKLPFQFLHRADPRQLVSFIHGEHPQVIAVVLAHLASEKATLVLSGLEAGLQADVAHRIAVMDRPRPSCSPSSRSGSSGRCRRCRSPPRWPASAVSTR